LNCRGFKELLVVYGKSGESAAFLISIIFKILVYGASVINSEYTYAIN